MSAIGVKADIRLNVVAGDLLRGKIAVENSETCARGQAFAVLRLITSSNLVGCSSQDITEPEDNGSIALRLPQTGKLAITALNSGRLAAAAVLSAEQRRSAQEEFA